MRIESFWAKGYRSLCDVRIDRLGPFNVFYGPNASGKSNILAAIQAWLQLVPAALGADRDAGVALREATHRQRDFTVHSPGHRITLGGTLVDVDAAGTRLDIEVQLDGAAKPKLLITTPPAPVLEKVEWARTFSLVSADRMPRTDVPSARPPEGEEPLSWYFRRGYLKDALFAAQNATSPATARALDRFRRLMSGPPLCRPAFRVVEDPHTGVRDLREWLPPPFDAHDISLDLAGLGVAQIYWILGQAMLSGAPWIGIEEPEAHLHAPTTGRHLRQLLVRLVEEKHIDQLFIATHSNLFDLDRDGYYDVSLEDGCTVVKRA